MRIQTCRIRRSVSQVCVRFYYSHIMMYKAVREMHIGWITPEAYIEMDLQEMTLQDRFLAAIVKNNPDPAIGEYAQAELSGE